MKIFFLFFFFLALFFIFLDLIIQPYFQYITHYYFEQLTYTLYRPFLDQYFYSWSKIMINIIQTKNPNFLIKDPYYSQYLDWFKFLPDPDFIDTSIGEKVFNASGNYFPNLATIDNWDAEDEDLNEIINPITPDYIKETRVTGIIFISFIIFEICRRNPIFITGRLHEFYILENIFLIKILYITYDNMNQEINSFLTLPKIGLNPLTNNTEYSWLFQKLQISPLYHYLNWPGWYFIIPKFFFNKSWYNIIIQNKKLYKKPILYFLKKQYYINYWKNFRFYQLYRPISQINWIKKLKRYLRIKKKNFKHAIIWFGKGIIEFFLTTTILPRFRFKRKKLKYTNLRIVKQILLMSKQKRVFFLRKESFKKNFRNFFQKKD